MAELGQKNEKLETDMQQLRDEKGDRINKYSAHLTKRNAKEKKKYLSLSFYYEMKGSGTKPRIRIRYSAFHINTCGWRRRWLGLLI